MSFTPPIIAPTIYLEIEGTLEATLPVPYYGLPKDIDASVPVITCEFEQGYAAQIEVTLPLITGAFEAALGSQGSIDATLPVPTVLAEGGIFTIDAEVTLPEASLEGSPGVVGEITAQLPHFITDLEGEVTILGSLSGQLPRLEANLSALTGVTGTISVRLPKSKSLLTGSAGTIGLIDAELFLIEMESLGFSRIEGSINARIPHPDLYSTLRKAA